MRVLDKARKKSGTEEGTSWSGQTEKSLPHSQHLGLWFDVFKIISIVLL